MMLQDELETDSGLQRVGGRSETSNKRTISVIDQSNLELFSPYLSYKWVIFPLIYPTGAKMGLIATTLRPRGLKFDFEGVPHFYLDKREICP